tara:strand:- start:209 stop:664 length:456 start_codon:yes stop_codon:yes gene_type:complete
LDIKETIEALAKLKGVKDTGMIRARTSYIEIERDNILDIAKKIKDEFGFDHCACISAVDYQTEFEIIYHFARIDDNGEMIEMRVTLPRDSPTIDSITELWGGADWHEREAYDLMGIYFIGHPNLKRVLLPDGFAGHPLRKDYVYEIHEEEW